MTTANPVMLNDKEILEAVATNTLGIHPFSETNIQPNSYDVTLSNSFIMFTRKGASDHIVDPFAPMPQDVYISITQDEIVIQPGEFILGETQERVKLPSSICGKLEGKSSIGRLGLNIQNAGFIDAGFEGTITLELYNCSIFPIRLRKGMSIGQILFTMINPCKTPYNKKRTAKYNNQSGATPSRYYLNKPASQA